MAKLWTLVEMSRKKEKINTEKALDPMGSQPFAGLDAAGLPKLEPKSTDLKSVKSTPSRNRGRLEIRREKSGRAGKTVTTVRGFKGIARSERESMLKDLKKQTGSGGSLLEDGGLLLQGDCRDQVKPFLESLGFQAVPAGG